MHWTRGLTMGSWDRAPSERLVPTLHSLWQWAEQWVPEDPALARRDPSVIVFWLQHRVDRTALPSRQVAIQFGVHLDTSDREWLLLASGAEPEVCQQDPGIDEDRYVFVEADADALYPISRGEHSWNQALAAGSVQLFGAPELVSALPRWFLPTRPADQAVRPSHQRGPRMADPVLAG